MTHTICRECETCSICMKSGCRGYLDKLEALVLEREIANRAPLVFPVIDGALIQEGPIDRSKRFNVSMGFFVKERLFTREDLASAVAGIADDMDAAMKLAIKPSNVQEAQ